jgi:hypothetical protein
MTKNETPFLPKEIITLVEEGVRLLPPSSRLDIEKKAARFLVLKAGIADAIWALESKTLEATSVVKADYIRALDEVDVKTIAEKQLRADADSDYLDNKKTLGECKIALDWLQTYADIFNNAHIFYRQQMKQE